LTGKVRAPPAFKKKQNSLLAKLIIENSKNEAILEGFNL
jgi:hypothetical protein